MKGRTIMYSFSEPDETANPYVTMLATETAREFNVLYFSWKNAIFGRYDVFHAHWPEYTVRGTTKLRSICRLAVALLWMLRVWVSGIPIVVTVHNQHSHDDIGVFDRLFLFIFDRLVWIEVFLNSSPENDYHRGVVITHGTYRSWYCDGPLPSHTTPSGLITYFGMVRPYKGVESLISAFVSLERPTARLTIAGKPVDDQYRATLAELAKGSERIALDLRHIPDRDLVSLITASDIIVLPYRYMYNSGAVILAISLETAVLVPDSPANRVLREEVGKEWIHLFNWPLGARDLQEAWEKASTRAIDTGLPNLNDRSWELGRARHGLLYKFVIASGRRRRPSLTAIAELRRELTSL